MKNVVLMVTEPDGSSAPLVVGVPGDREVDLKRLAAQLEPAAAEPFDDADFDAYPMLVKGYIGPQALGADSASAIRFLVDPRVVEGTRWITGANVNGQHVFDLVCGRDFTPDGTIEAAEVRAGDPAPDGSGPLRLARGIEMGHIFQLGRKFAEALGLKVLDANGKLVTVTMGSYGVGVSRAVAAVAENTSDEKGSVLAAGDRAVRRAPGGGRQGRGRCCWPPPTWPPTWTRPGSRCCSTTARCRPGVKFADAEILGMPTIVVVGRGTGRRHDRGPGPGTGERTDVDVAEATGRIVAVVHGRPDFD